MREAWAAATDHLWVIEGWTSSVSCGAQGVYSADLPILYTMPEAHTAHSSYSSSHHPDLLWASPTPPRSFGLVDIPLVLRVQLVVGIVAVAVSTYLWEHGLRRLLPAPRPPARGYMVHSRDLRAAAAVAAARKKAT